MSAKHRALLVLFLLGTAPAFGQFKIGVRAAPGVSFNRVATLDSTQSWSTNAAAAAIVVGPFVDIVFANNYYFSTGVWFATKQFSALPSSATEADARNVQYVQLPLTVKLYTDEVRLDTRIYVQMGGVGEVRIGSRDLNAAPYVPEPNLFDASLLFSTGVEYRWGFNTLVFAGFSYQLALINSISGANATYSIENDIAGLELGLKF